jgi:hypothetical protein
VSAPSIYPTGDTNTGIFFPAADTIAFSEGGVESMRIDSSGNVGIGTSSLIANTKLDVRGRIRTGSGSSSGDAEVTWSNYASATSAWLASVRQDVGGTNNDLKFLRCDSSGVFQGIAMQITSAGGDLLVGTSATSNTNGVKITKGGAAGGGIIELMKTGSGNTNGLLNYYLTTYVGGINFDNTSTSFPTSSDIRLKKDIVDAPSATQKIDNIRIVSHGWKHDDAVVEFGVIAQELVSVAPNAVMQGDDGEEVVTTWSVDYSKLVPLLIKAHQEQQTLIQDLTARLEAVENK